MQDVTERPQLSSYQNLQVVTSKMTIRKTENLKSGCFRLEIVAQEEWHKSPKNIVKIVVSSGLNK